MERESKANMRGRGDRQPSIFRSMDDYDRHMQNSVGTDDDELCEELPHEPYAAPAAADDTERRVAD